MNDHQKIILVRKALRSLFGRKGYVKSPLQVTVNNLTPGLYHLYVNMDMVLKFYPYFTSRSEYYRFLKDTVEKSGVHFEIAGSTLCNYYLKTEEAEVFAGYLRLL